MSEIAKKYPSGFRPRRGLNWFIIGLLYASFYTCRYNFRWATPGMVEEFGFSKFQITSMLSAWALAYGTGQLINGLLTDRIGGKKAMLIGAAGTICINLVYGFASFISTFATFSLIWLINGGMRKSQRQSPCATTSIPTVNPARIMGARLLIANCPS